MTYQFDLSVLFISRADLLTAMLFIDRPQDLVDAEALNNAQNKQGF